MKPILEIHNISKKFQINANKLPYLNLRDSISDAFKRQKKTEEFWALKDLNFNVQPGESIGIIGKNGAGKSTFLKILSKITPPTSGKIISRGRIASLLEVGTGFHPELSGRENIFMNGSILGMKRTEIVKNFDAIVDFSNINKFLDTPLKHYSSGMQLRLAFAVAAFLEPEILVIDEVLAVGDAEFQKKCLGKMESVSKSGRTILFVSHNMETIVSLCPKSILLNKGTINAIGPTDEIARKYLTENESTKYTKAQDANKKIFFKEISTSNSANNQTLLFGFNESINVEFSFVIQENIPSAIIGFAVFDKFKGRICTIQKTLKEICNGELATNQEIKVKIELPNEFFVPDVYFFDFAIYLPKIEIIDKVEDAIMVTIFDTGNEFTNNIGNECGNVILRSKWEVY